MKKNTIKENLDNPVELEKLHRKDKKTFVRNFENIYPDITGNALADYWKIRLDFDKPKEKAGRIHRSDTIALIITCITAGILIKLPEIINISLNDFLFYEKNAGLIFFLGLSMYTIWSNKYFERSKLIISSLAFIIPAVYINLLPSDRGSQSINLAYIHLPLFVWCVYGLIYMNYNTKDKEKRMDYIKYNGDLAILGAILLIAGMVLTGITIGLFSAISVNIENFYFEYIVVWGLVSAPVVAGFIIKNYPFVTNRIAPIIAKIFSPLVLITLIIYLIIIPISGKDPYNDRDFLLVFNMMLIGVMGIIVFSISETSISKRQKFNEMILFVLAIITLIIDLVALSAIFYRLGEYGITPNRMAVLGSNLLIFGNLIWITIDLYRVNFRKSNILLVEMTIAKYLPIYMVWTLLVVFGFPILFGLK